MVRRWSALALLILCLALPSPRPANAAVARPPSRPLAALDADGVWQQFGMLADSFYPSWYDAAHDRLVALGDWDPGARALPLSGALQWQGLPGMPFYVHPYYSNTAWDTETGDAYVLSYDYIPSLAQTLWRVTPGTSVSFVPVIASGTPPPPLDNAIVRFDHATQRLFVMGGENPSTYPYQPDSNLHVLQLGPSPAWSTLTLSGQLPGPYASMMFDCVVDPARHRLVLFSDSFYDSVWTLSTDSPTAWNAVPVGIPPGTRGTFQTNNGHVLDPEGDRVLIIDYAGQPWEFSLAGATWTPITAAGTGPGTRQYSSLTWDSARHRLLMHGGRQGAFTPKSGLWSVTLDGAPAWTQLLPETQRPAPRLNPGVGYDPVRNRLLVLGGQDRYLYNYPIADPAWAVNLGSTPTWDSLGTVESPPSGVSFANVTYDPVRDQFVFLGSGSSITTLSLGGATPTWGTLTVTGATPPIRNGASVVYDPVRDRFLFMCGWPSSLTAPAEVWELRLSPVPTWRQMAPGGTTPVTRGFALTVYDPAHDRVIVFGGVSMPDTLPTSTLSLDLSSGDGSWQELSTTSAPPGRRSGVFTLDPLRGRAILYGGDGYTNLPPPANRSGPLNDAWALDLTGTPAWRQLATQGATPTGPQSPYGAYDAANDRLALVSLVSSGVIDPWTLSFGGSATATEVALETHEVSSDHVTLVWANGTPGGEATAYRRIGDAPWQSLGTLACDGLGRFTLTDRDVTPGTRIDYRLGLGAGSSERFVGATTVDVPALELAMRAGLTVDRRVQLLLQLPAAGTARLALYDVSGRRVWNRTVNASASGVQAVQVDAAGLGQGLYFARMQWGGEVRRARVVLIR